MDDIRMIRVVQGAAQPDPDPRPPRPAAVRLVPVAPADLTPQAA